MNLLDIANGAVIAPAGCGKTHLIAEALRGHDASKRVLVLTHTNAGVAALRNRLQGMRVSSSRFRLHTIDGWAILITQGFPIRSGVDVRSFEIRNPRNDYPAIRRAAVDLLKAGHVNKALEATYAHVIVDEYQDCSVIQHNIVKELASVVPTCILGDPLQAVFGFGGDLLPDWDSAVLRDFPVRLCLETPWRWINAEMSEFGDWLLRIRSTLLRGEPLDLTTAPGAVLWIPIGEAEIAADSHFEGTCMVIGDSRIVDSRNELAKRLDGASIVEPVDLKDLISFGRSFDPHKPGASKLLARFASMTMVLRGSIAQSDLGVAAPEISRANPGTPSKIAGQEFKLDPTYTTAARFLSTTRRQENVRAFRPALLDACVRSLKIRSEDRTRTLLDAALQVREQFRRRGRILPRMAVGSTLLLKGLEADAAIVMDADAMDSQHLYVALTRAAKQLLICSKAPILEPIAI